MPSFVVMDMEMQIDGIAFKEIVNNISKVAVEFF